MDTIPEELLDRIVSYCKPQPDANPSQYSAGIGTLYALCLTSRKVSRIAGAQLNSITFVHSNSGPRGRSLLRTLRANPTFAKCITSFSAVHSCEDDICEAGAKTLRHIYKRGRDPFDNCERLLTSTLQLFPNLQNLDLSGFVLSDPNSHSRRLWLDLIHLYVERDEDWYPGPFSTLQRLSVNLHTMGVEEIWPVFTLKALKEVELGLKCQLNTKRDYWQGAYFPRGSSAVENVVLRDPHPDRVWGGGEQFEHISRACTSIKCVKIFSGDLTLASRATTEFWKHFGSGVLRTVHLIAYPWVHEYEFEKVAVVALDEVQIQKEFALLLGPGRSLWEKEARLMESEHFRLVKMRTWMQEEDP